MPTILVVDDAPMLREFAQRFLASAGRVITAEDGDDALRQARADRPDLVITDLAMPRLDGEGLCRALRADPCFTSIPVIAMIGEDGDHEHARAIRAGANDVLAKPLSQPLLMETVRRFLRFEPPRAQPRITFDAAADLRWGTHYEPASVRNLSRGGIFVENPSELDPGTEVNLRFSLPGWDEPFEPTASVVWQRSHDDGEAQRGSHGHGLRIVDIEVADLRLLDQFVHERARLPVRTPLPVPAVQ